MMMVARNVAEYVGNALRIDDDPDALQTTDKRPPTTQPTTTTTTTDNGQWTLNNGQPNNAMNIKC